LRRDINLKLMSTVMDDVNFKDALKYVLPVAAGLVLTGAGVYAYGRYVLSKILHREPAHVALRYAFKDMQIQADVEGQQARNPDQTHTHPVHAKYRSLASAYAARLATSVGLLPEFYQCSKRDLEHGYAGSREYYDFKDVAVPPLLSSGNAGLHVMVDVDYYPESPFVYSDGKPILMYTILPQAVGRSDNEVTASFDKFGVYNMNVAGGARYRHHLWNHTSDDVFVVDHRTFCGLLGPFTVYQQDVKHVFDDRAVVLYTPLAHYTGVVALVARCARALGLLRGASLERIKPNVCEGFVCLRTMTSAGTTVSIGRVDSPYALTLPETDFEAARCHYLSCVSSYGQAHATVALEMEKRIVQLRGKAGLMAEFFKANPGPLPILSTGTAVVGERKFTHNLDGVSETPLAVPFMRPFVSGGAYVPLGGLPTQIQAAEGRVKKFTGNKVDEMPIKYLSLAVEFCQHAFPEAGILDPCSIEEVLRRQPAPGQQQRNVAAITGKPDPVKLQVFVKRETYGKPTDPRIISPAPAIAMLEWSTYMYPLADHFAQFSDCGRPGMSGGRSCPWYAFGMKPAEICEAVAAVAENAKVGILDTDANRFDGNVKLALREFDQMLLSRAYAQRHHGHLSKVRRKTFGYVAQTNGGFEYWTDATQLSGFPDTAALNSARSAFFSYAALRLQGLTPAQAWQGLGLYGGDDGFTADLDADIFQSVAQDFGMSMECVFVRRGEMGVNFLGRYYSPDVFTGDTNTMIDFGRMIVKLHLTVDPDAAHPAAKWRKFSEKLTSLACTDMHTPVVQELLDAATRTGRWKRPTAEEANFVVNTRAPWMDYVIDQACLKLSLDRDGLVGWLSRVNTVTQLLECPGFGVADVVLPKTPIIMDGEVVLPAGATLGPDDVFKLGRSTHVQVHESKASAKADAKAERPRMDDKGKEEAHGCRDCSVSFAPTQLSAKQSEKMQAGEPYRCRDCAAKSKVRFENYQAAKAAGSSLH
jgi:hypothetical protein